VILSTVKIVLFLLFWNLHSKSIGLKNLKTLLHILASAIIDYLRRFSLVVYRVIMAADNSCLQFFFNCLHTFSKLHLFFSKLYTQIQKLHTKCKMPHISCKMKHCIQNITNTSQKQTFVLHCKHLCYNILLLDISYTHNYSKPKALLSWAPMYISVQDWK